MARKQKYLHDSSGIDANCGAYSEKNLDDYSRGKRNEEMNASNISYQRDSRSTRATINLLAKRNAIKYLCNTNSFINFKCNNLNSFNSRFSVSSLQFMWEAASSSLTDVLTVLLKALTILSNGQTSNRLSGQLCYHTYAWHLDSSVALIGNLFDLIACYTYLVPSFLCLLRGSYRRWWWENKRKPFFKSILLLLCHVKYCAS